jgi:Tfp pilus assembly protein PilV
MGFSLLEALLALAILTIAILVVSGSQVAIGSGDQRNEISARAGLLAAEKIEELLASPLAQVLGGSDAITGPDGVQFARTWTVQIDSPVAGTRTVVVTVSQPALQQPVRLATIVTEGM